MTTDIPAVAATIYTATPAPVGAGKPSSEALQQGVAVQAEAKAAAKEAAQPDKTSKPVQDIPQASIRMNYKQHIPVMSFYDHNALLIYQFPGKGRLDLLQLVERADLLKTSA